MARIKKHWKPVSLIAVLAVLGSAGAWRMIGADSSTTALAEGIDGFTPVSGVQRDNVLGVLHTVELDQAAMAALNVTAQQAIDTVSDARSWLDENSADLDSLANTIGQRLVTVQRLEKAQRLGPFDAQTADALTAARAALADARRAYRAALEPLETELATNLSPSQQATWRIIQRGWDRAMPYRMLDLSMPERCHLGRALRHYQLQLAAAGDADERSAAESRFQSTLASILSQDEVSVIAAYNEYAPTAAQAVVDAYDTVLPSEATG